MKTNVRETSLAAYQDLQDSNALGKQSKAVLDAYKIRGSACDADVAADLNMDKSTVSARRNHLMKLGLLKEAYKGRSRLTGKTVWYFQPHKEQAMLFGRRFEYADVE